MKHPYNIEWIKNVRIQQTAEHWFNKKLITENQLMTVKTTLTGHFYNPGIFVKVGLFIFALVACSFFCAFLSLFIPNSSAGDTSICWISIISAIGFITILEILIKDRKLFHSGVDNALLYAALGASLTPYFILMSDPPVWLTCCFMLSLLVTAFLRYADMITIIAAFIVLIGLLGNIMLKFTLGTALLPFAVMSLSAGIYILNKKADTDYYHNCQLSISAMSLITFYLASNYYIVREGNALLNNLSSPIAPQIPFAPVFYLLTSLIPVLYIVFGLRKKDRSLFIIGLFAFGFSLFTFRFYFGFLTPELGLTIAGIGMIVISIAAIQYLKTPKHTLTDDKEGANDLGNLQALIAAQHLGQTPVEKNISFGSGNFGGGGAGNDY